MFRSGGIKRIVLTGAPGTGKTSLIEALGALDYPVHRENARAWISEHIERPDAPMPWHRLEEFSRKMIEAGIDSYDRALPGEFNFYDRGLPDTLAYLKVDGKPIPSEWISLMTTYRYEEPVFIAPLWPDISSPDTERKESLDQALRIHEALSEVYDSLGYRLVELPKAPLEERLDFVFKKLS